MKRLFAVVTFALSAVLLNAQPARADLWDFLQEWSGPGPFHTGGNVMAQICPLNGKLQSSFDRYSRDNATCYFLDFRRFLNQDDDNFGAGKVSVEVYEFGGVIQLHQAVELGFGGGFLHFSSQDREKGGVRAVLTAPRFVVKPALFFAPPSFWDGHPTGRKWLSILKYYARENIIVGTMRGADFGLTMGEPNFNFKVSNDRVFSTGFLIDLTELLR